VDKANTFIDQDNCDSGTGSNHIDTPVYERVVPFGGFEIVVLLGSRDEFMGIREIRISKNFLSPDQIVKYFRSVDVSDLYEDDE